MTSYKTNPFFKRQARHGCGWRGPARRTIAEAHEDLRLHKTTCEVA